MVLAVCGGLTLGLAVAGPLGSPTVAAATATPDKITKVWVTKDRVGTFTVRWSAGGRNTTGYAIETGLTTFSKTDRSQPSHGRHEENFHAAKTARSFTFTAADLRRAGAPLGSGNHVYFRVSALNDASSGRQQRYYPYLQTAMPLAATPQGSALRVGSFNVRTSHAADRRSWLQRVPDVAATITRERPAVVAVQELNVGRADGVTGTLRGHARQTDSLVSTLRSRHAGQYRLVRTTPYVKPGTPQSTQGQRILFDSRRLRLDSHCPNTTGKASWSGSCSVSLPIAAGDSRSHTRRAAFARFTDKTTGRSFYFVSVHLDERHTGSMATQRKHDRLRAAQMATVQKVITSVNTRHLPVIIAGDYNTWQNHAAGNSAHDWLISQGYRDGASAPVQVDIGYSTLNDFAGTVKRAGSGYGSRLDQILVKGMKGSKRYENVMKVTDSRRPSDHNLVVSDLVF